MDAMPARDSNLRLLPSTGRMFKLRCMIDGFLLNRQIECLIALHAAMQAAYSGVHPFINSVSKYPFEIFLFVYSFVVHRAQNLIQCIQYW